MKRFLFAILAIAFLFCVSVPAAMAGYDHYTITVKRDLGYATTAGGHTTITSGVQYLVFNGGGKTLSTIYSDAGITSRANPVNSETFAIDDKIDFYIDDSNTTVDIIVVDNAGGFTAFLDGVTTSVHNCIIDERYGVMHHGMYWYTGDTGYTASEVSISSAGTRDTGIDFLGVSAVYDVAWEPLVASSTSGHYIEVGAGADDNGLLVTQLIDGVAFNTPDRYSATNDSEMGYGDLLKENTATDGFFYTSTSEFVISLREPYFTLSDTSLEYTIGSDDEHSSNDFDGVWGLIHYWFSRLR